MMQFISDLLRKVFWGGFLCLIRFLAWIAPPIPSSPWINGRRDMSATALNDRRSSGMRCKGFLGRPAVVMLG